VGATAPFLNYNLVAGQPGVVKLGAQGANTFAPLNLGADTFRFNGFTQTGTIYVGSNGYITFGSGNTSSTFDNMGDTSALNQAAIAPLWAGWRVDGNSSLLVKTLDLNNDGHDDWLIVQWNNVKQINGGGKATFQAILQLNSGTDDGDVWFNYVYNGAMCPPGLPGKGVSVGVKDANGAPANPLLVSQTLPDPNLGSGHALLVTRYPANTSSLSESVANLPPTLSSLSASRTTIDEGAMVNLSGQFSDPSALDTFTVNINWGDGNPQSVSRGAGATDFGPISHTYGDEGSYTIVVTVTDDDGGMSNSMSLTITVNNVPPKITGVSATPVSINEGQSVNLSGAFTDPSSFDTFTATVNWGDGTSGPATVNGQTKTFTATHVYDDGAVPFTGYTISVTVQDDDLGSDTNSTFVHVANVPPTANFSATAPSFVTGTPITFAFSDQFDPSNADTSAGFTYFYDFTNSGTLTAGPASQTHVFNTPGTYTVKGRIEDKDLGFTDLFTTVTIGQGKISYTAVGSNQGGSGDQFAGAVQVFDTFTGGPPKYTFFPYGQGFTGGVRVAVADVLGHGVPDIITAAGSFAPRIEVFDGRTGNKVFDFYAFNPFSFNSGVNIAAADLNGDGKADLIIGQNQLGIGSQLSHVEVLDGSKLGQVMNGGQISPIAVLADFIPYNFNGEIRVAAGDVNGDGVPDIITGPGPGGGPEVKVIDGTKINQVDANGQILPSALVFDFNALSNLGLGNDIGGIFVAAGDLNGDGFADLIVAQGTGTGAHLITFSGTPNGTLVPTFMKSTVPFASSNGITVAAIDPDGHGLANIIVGSGPGVSPSVLTLNGLTLDQTSHFSPFDTGFIGGVYVG
jgi:hypothetical protein